MQMVFILGTKAQFIKTIPMINHAIEKGINVILFDLKQHPEKSELLIKKIKGSYKYLSYVDNNEDIGTYIGLIKWSLKILLKILLKKEKLIKNNFAIVHGDTLSTLLGSILVKRNRGNLVLLEAGLGFPGFFKHFPESFVRYFVAKMSNSMIANGSEQIFQLEKWKVKGRVIEISRNTIYDSLNLVDLKKSKESKKVVVSIHRTENIYSRENMKKLVNNILDIPNELKVVWYLHIPTKNKLKQFNLLKVLYDNKILLRDLLPYEEFLNELYSSDFVISDGDGVVEECHILGIPTLVWRYEHLDSTHLFEGTTSLFLSEYNKEKCKYFFNNYSNFRNFNYSQKDTPSLEALNKLIENE